MSNSVGNRRYRDVVQASLGAPERLKRNVLEIRLDKEDIGDGVEEDAVAKLFSKLGIRPEQVEGVQMVPQKFPRKIFVWFELGVDINRYCFHESYRLSDKVKTGLIKPMDKREVEVLIRGLNINTPDGSVLNYLSHFGKIVRQEVIYVRNKDGPFRGLKNGDRKYIMDFSGGINLDSYHLIDGAKVNISFYCWPFVLSDFRLQDC